MLVVHNNQKSWHWHYGDPVPKPPCIGDVVIAIDPSKTNMAILLGTPTGEVLDTIEFSGNNRKRGPVMDTTLYCDEVRKFLAEYLGNLNLFMVGVEQAITEKNAAYHHSNMVLTEIRSNLLNFFLEHYRIKVIEINNWSWKSHILPEGYRSPYEKGSKKWFTRNMPDSPWSSYFEADMTDCICIYLYMIQVLCKNYTLYCNRVESNIVPYNYIIEPLSALTDDIPQAQFNERYSLEDNMCFYVNRSIQPFTLIIDTEILSPEMLYGHTLPYRFGFENLQDTSVAVKVVRTT